MNTATANRETANRRICYTAAQYGWPGSPNPTDTDTAADTAIAYLESLEPLNIDYDPDTGHVTVTADAEWHLNRLQHVHGPNDLNIDTYTHSDHPDPDTNPHWYSRHPDLTANDLHTLAQHCHHAAIVADLPNRPDLPENAWQALLQRPHEAVRQAILGSPHTPEPVRIEAALTGEHPPAAYQDDWGASPNWIEDYLPDSTDYTNRGNRTVPVPPNDPTLNRPRQWDEMGF